MQRLLQQVTASVNVPCIQKYLTVSHMLEYCRDLNTVVKTFPYLESIYNQKYFSINRFCIKLENCVKIIIISEDKEDVGNATKYL